MGRITAIRVSSRSGQNRGKRTKIFLDGQLAFTLETEEVVEHGLHVGQELSPDQIEALTREGHFYRCLNAATRYLSYRPRSEFELRERLRQRGFESDNIDAVIARLKEQGFVDDVAFAQFWKENRDTFSPRSQWLTGLELRRHGVAADIINTAVDDIDDNDSAYRAAASRARRLPLSDYEAFRRRLGDYLKRRGFSYGVIADTVRRLWQEMGGDSRQRSPRNRDKVITKK
jgi:regulatory protein